MSTVAMPSLPAVTDTIKQEIDRRERELEQLRKAYANLQGVALVLPAHAEPPTSDEYAELGIIEASRRFLTEVGKAMGTRELADALVARGLRSRSRNFVATVYATLANAKKEFRRTDRGEWELISHASSHARR